MVAFNQVRQDKWSEIRDLIAEIHYKGDKMNKRGRKKGVSQGKWSKERKDAWMIARHGKAPKVEENTVSANPSPIVESLIEAQTPIVE